MISYRDCDQEPKRLTVHPSANSQSGYTLAEILVVMAFIGILTGIAIFSISGSRTAYAADDQANEVVNYLREANFRAISTHHSYRVVINLATKNMTMINENTISGGGNNNDDTISGDDAVVKQEPLRSDVNIPTLQPTGYPLPPGRFNFPAATFSSNIWCVHFQSNGSATSTMGALFTTTPALVSCTLYFQPVGTNTSGTPGLVRAVTLSGATSAIRFWLYNGSAFIEG